MEGTDIVQAVALRRTFRDPHRSESICLHAFIIHIKQYVPHVGKTSGQDLRSNPSETHCCSILGSSLFKHQEMSSYNGDSGTNRPSTADLLEPRMTCEFPPLRNIFSAVVSDLRLLLARTRLSVGFDLALNRTLSSTSEFGVDWSSGGTRPEVHITPSPDISDWWCRHESEWNDGSSDVHMQI